MEREHFVNNFSQRLNSLLDRENYSFKVGSKINQLAEVTGVSYQMARKYILGMALPDYHVIPKIAKWLKVSSSWLLFGETEFIESTNKSSTSIEIEAELLKYILRKCVILFPPTNDAEKIINYITGMIYDASHIETDNKTILKIVDMMLSSAIQLNSLNVVKRA